MAEMTVYVAPRGTLVGTQGPSTAGHMFFTLKDSTGAIKSYGFAPKVSGSFSGVGKVAAACRECQHIALLTWRGLLALAGRDKPCELQGEEVSSCTK